MTPILTTIIEALTICFVLAGAAFIFASFKPAQRTRAMAPDELRGKWKALIYLMYYFFAGYLLLGVLLASHEGVFHELVTGGIFLGCAIFVYIVIKLGQDSVQRTKEAERELEALNEFLEQRVAERTRELKQANEFNQMVLDSVNEPVSVVDVNTLLILGTNKAFRVKYGLRDAELLGKTCHEVTHHRMEQCAPPHYICPLPDTVSSGNPTSADHIHYTENGEKLYVEVSTTAIRNEEGKVVHVLHIERDVTGRRIAEEKAAATLKFTQAIIDASPIAILSYDSSGQALSANEAAAKAVGATVDQLLAQNYRQLESWSKSGLRDAADDSLSTGAERKLDVHMITTFGKEVWLACRLVPFLTDNRSHLLALLTDITERKRAEAEIAERTRELEVHARQQAAVAAFGRKALQSFDLENLMSGAVELVAEILDVEYCKVLELLQEGDTLLLRAGVGWNAGLVGTANISAGFDSQAGYTLLSKDPIVVADLAAETRFSGPQLLIDHAVVSGISVVIPGHLRPFGVLGAHTRGRRKFTANDSDFIQAIANILAEAIENKRAEEARKKLEAQLLHSQKMEAVGQLSGGIAHDFNNILAAIIGYGHILLMRMGKDDPLRINVEHLLEAADRAAHLIQGLLTFSRKQFMHTRPVDLNELITRMKKMLARVIPEDIEIKTVFKHEALMIQADSSQLDQILINLATNARDSMPRGGALFLETDTVELDEAFVAAHGYGEPGRYAVLSVTDTGLGMDEETRKRIFEPFFTTKDVGKGTGLGLAIVYGIVKQHGGYVNVYSEPGKGTSFSIYLPLSRSKPEKGENPVIAADKALPRGSETVLVAEDDEALRKLSRTLLEHAGYTVLVAANGEDAVNMFVQHQDAVQLAILDMIMPRKSGKEAYEEIRRIKPGIPVIFVSGYTADKLQIDDLQEEGVEFLSKPISVTVLIQKVRELLDRGKNESK
jgi:PAS domain S-box-containing protein